MATRGEFRFLDGIAPADAAFEATGRDLAEVFSASAQALFTIIVDIEQIKPRNSREVELTADSTEELLYAWLSELVYLKDVHRELYGEFEIEIAGGDRISLKAMVKGDSIDSLVGMTLTDVKAVTYHKLAVESTESGFRATVVVDL